MTESQNNLRSNQTIETLLNRRSIRKFKAEDIDEQTVATLETVAQHAASSQYLQDWSAVRVEDQDIKDNIAEICHQSYVAEAPLLYIFVADEHRNAAIAERKGVNIHSAEFTLNSSYRFSQAQNDAVLALHAMETAAYSLDLGCVILGSVLNEPSKLIELLHLPEFTYPVLGLALGKPDQSPALKPRMERSTQFFTDRYPADDTNLMHDLDEFDDTVHQYYDLRNTSRPVDAFSDQITKNAVDTGVFSRAVKPAAEKQGFRLDH
ncbi:nitroreductase family protein [Bifidobacterium sp. ESL0784]|uniref:nitroreductase family protein n=1 Tax=Bifidobacterium sp. ESL0784 TaxID=2983231 RepID=UPI0023F93098|nr:nitroreductase family protein [Bifidobacterium sp. ESL0784]MDF7640808.1 nitroreductase family protein [Bifidobacterium sp. ESL0784]